jgi:hypothetical protein
MVDEPIPGSGAMEADGAYNVHVKIPLAGAASILPLWEKTVRNVALDRDEQPIVIADYGVSQGKNSLVPMRIAIDALRSRVGVDRPVLVYHVDLAINDFNTLFKLLEDDPDSYYRDAPNVYPCGVGRSFYENVVPRNSVHIGWSSYAAMWISQIPTQLPGHIYVPCTTGDARAVFERRREQDWESFLSLRASELRPGGRLLVVVPGANEEGVSGFEEIMDQANAVLIDMVADGSITAAEYASMVLGVWPRRRSELLQPFAQNDRYQNLTVEHCETTVLEDPAWADFERDGNKEVLANKQAAFYRSVFAPSLAVSLTAADNADACRAFGDRLEYGLQRTRMATPVAINSLVETIILTKQGSTSAS